MLIAKASTCPVSIPGFVRAVLVWGPSVIKFTAHSIIESPDRVCSRVLMAAASRLAPTRTCLPRSSRKRSVSPSSNDRSWYQVEAEADSPGNHGQPRGIPATPPVDGTMKHYSVDGVGLGNQMKMVFALFVWQLRARRPARSPANYDAQSLGCRRGPHDKKARSGHSEHTMNVTRS
jgi:hypothetical protein